MFRIVSVAVALSLLGNGGLSARILGVFPFPSFSHQIVFRGLTMELAKRGHELIVVTPDPIRDSKLQNYKEIDLHPAYDLAKKYFDFNNENDIWKMNERAYDFGKDLMDMIFSHPEMQQIISRNSTEHFDLILVEFLYFESLYGLMSRFNAPAIGITSLPLSTDGQIAIGNPLLSAHSPHIITGYSDDMNIWQRMHNLYVNTRLAIHGRFQNLPIQDKIMRTYFGEDLPHVDDLRRNVSMVFVNAQTLLTYPRANVPGYLEIGGFHFKKENKELAKDLKNFLDSAKEGFIYFSLGSNVKSNKLPEAKRREFLSAFAELPYKVLWKWESDSLPGKPDNVFISKWLPQEAVLGHPNILAFIYQGGLQSTEEAINHVVPLIGLPFVADQEYNVNKVVSLGIAERLHFDSLEKEAIKDVVLKVATDIGYKERVLKARELLNDRMVDPLDQAVWWTEYVIRHKGAPHLRSRARLMPWYQLELLDVFALLAAVLAIGIYAVYRFVYFIISLSITTYESLYRKKIKSN